MQKSDLSWVMVTWGYKMDKQDLPGVAKIMASK